MRGYEMCDCYVDKMRETVPNPHEGLWEVHGCRGWPRHLGSKSPWGVMSMTRLGMSISVARFQIPMRGYEIVICDVEAGHRPVPNPHEGLWVYFCRDRRLLRFEFQIPMRGYEFHGLSPSPHSGTVPNPHEGLWDCVAESHLQSAWRSKSPWGVMRTRLIISITTVLWFQIPMRGYEDEEEAGTVINFSVPNPHEGLWELDMIYKDMRDGSSKSPWGVMSSKAAFIN